MKNLPAAPTSRIVRESLQRAQGSNTPAPAPNAVGNPDGSLRQPFCPGSEASATTRWWFVLNHPSVVASASGRPRANDEREPRLSDYYEDM